MRFQNLTRRNEIGANAYLLTLGGTRILLDAGMHPKERGRAALPDYEALPPGDLDAVIISHAHLDHAGSLPLIQQRHPEAKVYLTRATADLAEAMLHNSVNVMTSQREELEVYDYPLFTHREVDRARTAWEPVPPGQRFSAGPEDDPVEIELYHAGHVLGSAGVMLRYRERTLFYTGDVHFENQTLTRKAAFPGGPIDVVISEATRGDHARPAGYTRRQEALRLAECIRAILGRGGTVLLPVFALGKTQEILTLLYELRSEDLIPTVPVFIGGLSTKMTLIHDAHASAPSAHRAHEDFRFLHDMELLLSTPRGRRNIRHTPGCIYALSSGMMTENTLSNFFAAGMLGDPCHGILFVGYADPASPAGRLLAARQGEPFALAAGDEPVPLACQVEQFDFSGHAPRDQILDFVVKAAPRQLFLVHGDPAALDWMKCRVEETLPACEAVVPPPGEAVPLAIPP